MVDTVLSISNENEFRPASANFDEKNCELSLQAKYRRHFRHLLFKLRRNFAVLNEISPRTFAVLNEISPRTFVSARRKFASYKRKFVSAKR